MEPRLGQHGRNVGRLIDVRRSRERRSGQRGKLFGVRLVHQAEAAELALDAVEYP